MSFCTCYLKDKDPAVYLLKNDSKKQTDTPAFLEPKPLASCEKSEKNENRVDDSMFTIHFERTPLDPMNLFQ